MYTAFLINYFGKTRALTHIQRLDFFVALFYRELLLPVSLCPNVYHNCEHERRGKDYIFVSKQV